MQHIVLLLFVFLWLIVANRSSSVGIQNVSTTKKDWWESTLLTTAIQPQPVKILLFSAGSIGSTHMTEEHSACVKIRSEFRGSCVICGHMPIVQKEHRGY